VGGKNEQTSQNAVRRDKPQTLTLKILAMRYVLATSGAMNVAKPSTNMGTRAAQVAELFSMGQVSTAQVEMIEPMIDMIEKGTLREKTQQGKTKRNTVSMCWA